MKNLIIVHLESISWQKVASFPGSFPNLHRLFCEAVVYNWCIASATSTRMVITHLFLSNDYEYDLSSEFGQEEAAINNPDLFSLLRKHGWQTDIICLDALRPEAVHLAPLAGVLPTVWATNDHSQLLDKFDALTDAPLFAIYVWNLITHLEHHHPIAPSSDGLTDQVARSCAMADAALGAFVATLQRKGLLENTTLVVFGDHGDDFWTHGFKGGLTHATEPYTGMVHVPLAIRDPSLSPRREERMASTLDIAPTCLHLLGVNEVLPCPESGRSLLAVERDFAFAQNFFASQPDSDQWSIRKAFSVADHTHTLLVSSAGLELYAHRLDPGNHCNLLHFFDLNALGHLVLRAPATAGLHFCAALRDNPRALECLNLEFQRLKTALSQKIERKREYVIQHGGDAFDPLDPNCFNVINREGRSQFFGSGDEIESAS